MIFISVGHHPHSKGASFKDFNEFDAAKLWVPLIVNHLGHQGMSVPVGTLREKVAFINSSCKSLVGSHLAVEIHFNMAWKDKDGDGEVDNDEYLGRGSETLYYPGSEKGKQLATHIQEKLSLVYAPNRGAKEGWYRMNKKNGPDFFLKRTACTSIIIEPEFVHNAEKIREGREAGCKLISDVLLNYTGE